MPWERCVELIPFLMQYKKHLIILGAIAAALIFYFLNKQPTQQPDNPLEPVQPVTPTTNVATTATPQQPKTDETSIAVDIKGAVKKPGVYELEASDRVYDAIIAAGGYKDNANSKAINHAAHVQDEMVIYVPKKGEKIDSLQVSTTTGSSASASSSSSQTADTPVVNINTADEAELQTISGIGPAKAKAIIQYRLDNGPFQTVDDLTKVSGFGEKTLERLRSSITVQ